MKWLLDTNAVIHAQRGRPHGVKTRLTRTPLEDVSISAITVAELWYGAEKSPDPERKRALWSEFLAPFRLLSFDRSAAEHHGRLRHQLRHNPIGERDLLIASIALAHGMRLVTANEGEFRRVPGLEVENWSAEV